MSDNKKRKAVDVVGTGAAGLSIETMEANTRVVCDTAAPAISINLAVAEPASTPVVYGFVDVDKLKNENDRLRKRCRALNELLNMETQRVMLHCGVLNTIQNMAQTSLCPKRGIERVLTEKDDE